MIYKYEEVFEDIPGDSENCIMKIPPEVLEQLGWKEGDTITITSEEGTITLSKKNG
jgi:AbrB family looped-hinge helix DNA binding protein